MYNQWKTMIDNIIKTTGNNYAGAKFDKFMEDVDEFNNFKILRLNRSGLDINVYVSFEFDDFEYFGVYKNFGSQHKPILYTDMYTDEKCKFITNEYRLKLSNYFYKILVNWFLPKKCKYKALKNVFTRDEFGKEFILKENSIVELLNSSFSDRIINLNLNGKRYYINNIDFYFFNYWFEEIV